MLGKLFKYEFKSTAKIMLTLYAVLAAVTALGSIFLSMDSIQERKNDAANLVVGSLILLYVLTVLALFIVTYVYLCVHFFKTMYSNQGYLTHTLPVGSLSIFNVKLITSLVWMLCSILLLLGSIVALTTALTPGAAWNLHGNYSFHTINEFFNLNFHMNFISFIAWMLFSVLVSCLSYLMLVFTSASIGQLFHQYKSAASIIAGVVLYFVQQIISMIFLLFHMDSLIHGVTTSISSGTNMNDPQIFTDISVPFFSTGFLLEIGFIVIYYIVCSVIVRKHINLE